TEEELLKAIRAEGDMQCLGELYRRFGHLAYGVCLKYLKDRELAQDAVMEVWEKLAVELRKREVEKFSAWLHVLTRNHCLMQLRAAKSKATDSFSEINGHVVESAMVEHPTSEEGDQLENKLQQLEAAIASLPDEQKSCIKLFFLEKKSYQQVAELTGYDLKKVKSYIQNGKRNLKNALQRHHEEG
ncbi:MAG TPA: RNA polymerase subunit sigma-70, partial [Cytophagales bacterium]|nr:RNA polymerase subunit sigma-70 [Cytophagales bacterium]